MKAKLKELGEYLAFAIFISTFVTAIAVMVVSIGGLFVAPYATPHTITSIMYPLMISSWIITFIGSMVYMEHNSWEDSNGTG